MTKSLAPYPGIGLALVMVAGLAGTLPTAVQAATFLSRHCPDP
jgi:hypothetical protein